MVLTLASAVGNSDQRCYAIFKSDERGHNHLQLDVLQDMPYETS